MAIRARVAGHARRLHPPTGIADESPAGRARRRRGARGATPAAASRPRSSSFPPQGDDWERVVELRVEDDPSRWSSCAAWCACTMPTSSLTEPMAWPATAVTTRRRRSTSRPAHSMPEQPRAPLLGRSRRRPGRRPRRRRELTLGRRSPCGRSGASCSRGCLPRSLRRRRRCWIDCADERRARSSAPPACGFGAGNPTMKLRWRRSTRTPRSRAT